MRIDAEFLCDHVVTFYPQNRAEAAAIQQALFALGPVWSTGVPEVRNIEALVRDGMTVADGQIFVGIDQRDAAIAVSCTAVDLGIAPLAQCAPAVVIAPMPKVTR